ncbi:alkylpyrone methyltransferase [Bacillus carboniphilus]|uniref:Alkylpyrone methyltransferase n=1 Tax=Bacillus carboniphilus TaxID=86663 RepID=A0ABN0WVV3_9BACI
MSLFWAVFVFLIFQRLVELRIAKRNEIWMKQQGAIEFGKEHYGLMVAMHIAFFVSLMLEVILFKDTANQYWPVILGLFIITQAFRVWIIKSLQRYWNTKILVIPNAKVIKSGPYRWMKHPNYLVVTVELLLIPLLFNAYLTLCLFFVLNQIILSIRIPQEEAILSQWTEYGTEFEEHARFIPSLSKKE